MASDDTTHGHWAELVAGVSVLHQEALDRLDVPALLVELPSRCILAANSAFAELIARPVSELIGHPNNEVIAFSDEAGMIRSLEAVSTGALDAYRAKRTLTLGDGVVKHVIAWGRAIDIDGRRSAVFIVSPRCGGVEPPQTWAGPLVIGHANSSLRITCISSDAREVLGWDPEQIVGKPLLGVHPEDRPDLLSTVRDMHPEDIVARHIRVRHRDGHYVRVQCLVVVIAESGDESLVFALVPDWDVPPPSGATPDRLTEMELRLRRIADELRAAGVLDDMHPMPTAEQFPQLLDLTSRQWQILSRLLRGQRVPTIARDLYLSPGTVRNHLAAIFERFDVHSQAELIALLRRN